jgi:uncharacterized protein YjbI with pentapeptide repeats
MNIIKSLHSSLLHRHFSFQEKHYFTASVLWGFNLLTGESVLEQDLWLAIGDMMGKSELFDAGMPKANAELLVQGSCYASDGEAVNASRVSVSLGSIEKELLVFGDRQWIKGLGVGWGVSDPEKFTEMPVSYSNAFGGQNYAANPVGKGIDEVDILGEQLIPLPNLEYRNDLIGSPGDKPRPASLNRIDMMCEQRMSKAGTYDQRYIETRMPGFPDDFNYDYFNDAATDQWIEGYFNGDEHYEIRNMHPEHAVIKGKIPGVYGRAFVNHQVNGEIIFKEIPTQLDTVWLFPSSALGILIHRGTLEVNEDDAADIKQILVANENTSDTPRALNHYKKELALRTNMEEAYKYAFFTTPLIPEGTTCGFKELEEKADFPYEQLLKVNTQNFDDAKQQEAETATQQQFDKMKELTVEGSPERQKIDARIQQLADAKVQPTELSPQEQKIKEITDKIVPMMKDNPKKPDMTRLNLSAVDELKVYMDELKTEKEVEAKNKMLKQIEELKKLDAGGGTSSQVKQLEDVLLAMELPPILPRIDMEGIIRQMKDQNNEMQRQLLVMQSMGLPEEQLAKIKLMVDPAESEKRMREGVDKANEGYRIGAHSLEQGRSPHEGQEVDIRAALLGAFKSGGKTAQGDYAFVDLSDQDLTGIDLSGAYLEYANLTNTNLSNANLSKAILSHAIFNGTNLTNTNLTEANLGSINFEGAVFRDADLTGAILSKSNLSNTQFERCKLIEKIDMFIETTFDKASFTGSDMRKNTFIDANISGCDFSGADLTESQMINPVMKSVNFAGANLTGVNFVKAQGDSSIFDSAIMKNVRFLGESSLFKASFKFAEVNEANLRDCDLQEANFTEANLHKSDFGGAILKNACFEKAHAIEAQFSKSDLTHANMQKINLMEGSLYKAILSAAKFNNANLYGVSFMGCTVGETDFTGADLDKTIFKDWRP